MENRRYVVCVNPQQVMFERERRAQIVAGSPLRLGRNRVEFGLVSCDYVA